MSKAFYLTTAIDYVNALPHVGTAYEKIAADALARFKRAMGVDTFFLMGVDEHSANVERQASSMGLSPKDYCDEMSGRFREVWHALGVSYDRFIRTTDPDHVETVKDIFSRILQKGDIYRGTYRGWYCVSCEAFLKEADLADGLCPSHGTKPEWIEEDNYFFALSRYGPALKRHIEEVPGFVLPQVRRNEILNIIDRGLDDISVSRAGMKWGIRCPADESQVIYVWFDALINYVTGAGYASDPEVFRSRWPADVHIVGKDITRFHCIIWPAMLMAAGIPLPRSVWGHGFVHLGGERMSKTKGTVLDPLTLCRNYGADALRYFLLREVPFDRDGDFTMERFIERYTSDLANALGNLCQRTLVFVKKYCGGSVPGPSGDRSDADGRLIAALRSAADDLVTEMNAMRFNVALERIWGAVQYCNRYIDECAPWRLRKEKGGEGRFSTVIYNLCEGLRAISLMISPFMPHTASGIREQLGLGGEAKSGCLARDTSFGLLEPGRPIGEVRPLFPKKGEG